MSAINNLVKISSPLLLAACVLAGGAPSGHGAEQMVMEVIPLKHRTAEEVVPILQPFVAEGGAISGMRNQVILSTTPSNLAEIKKILSSIDGELRRLMVSVRQDESRDIKGEEIGISVRKTVDGKGNLGAREGGSGNGINLGAKKGGDGMRVRALGGENPEEEGIIQQVQVLEGNTAFISIGITVPLTEYATVRNAHGTQVIEAPVYRDVMTGFYVLPRVSGDTVTLEISTQKDRLIDGRTGTTGVQHIDTSVSGRLGEWMGIGGMLHEARGKRVGIAHGGRRDGRDLRRVLIRVDEME